MKNRAKCKLCESVLESFHQFDYVECKCGEISIDGGEGVFKCFAKNWDNFLRIDDQGNVIVPKMKQKDEVDVKPLYTENEKPTKQDLIKILEDMIKNIENLPEHAMTQSVNQYDLMSLMMILVSIFKSDK